ncbi:hypothetical protein M0657_001594 [Pyricularia oryzae]|nr:hypothetical protein M0657_001594 [Pyricularia oryzae]
MNQPCGGGGGGGSGFTSIPYCICGVAAPEIFFLTILRAFVGKKGCVSSCVACNITKLGNKGTVRGKASGQLRGSKPLGLHAVVGQLPI